MWQYNTIHRLNLVKVRQRSFGHLECHQRRFIVTFWRYSTESQFLRHGARPLLDWLHLYRSDETLTKVHPVPVIADAPGPVRIPKITSHPGSTQVAGVSKISPVYVAVGGTQIIERSYRYSPITCYGPPLRVSAAHFLHVLPEFTNKLHQHTSPWHLQPTSRRYHHRLRSLRTYPTTPLASMTLRIRWSCERTVQAAKAAAAARGPALAGAEWSSSRWP